MSPVRFVESRTARPRRRVHLLGGWTVPGGCVAVPIRTRLPSARIAPGT